MIDLEGLPAAERVAEGMRDLAAGRHSIAALWLAAAPERLRDLGLPIPAAERLPGEPELSLYAELEAEPGVDDPYYRYNAMRAELDSFVAALEARLRRTNA